MIHTRDAEPKFIRKFCEEALKKRALSYARGPRDDKGAQKVGTPGHCWVEAVECDILVTAISLLSLKCGTRVALELFGFKLVAANAVLNAPDDTETYFPFANTPSGYPSRLLYFVSTHSFDQIPTPRSLPILPTCFSPVYLPGRTHNDLRWVPYAAGHRYLLRFLF